MRVLPARVLTITDLIIEATIAWHDATLLLLPGVFQVQDYVNAVYEVLRD
ncbi:hypothetical protein ES705_18068 [subsurface metagenome]